MQTPSDWNKLRVFYAAAEAGSFTQAASNLHMSQSSISRQVTSLELELGVLLFQRHARGLILTEQGETLFKTVHSMIEKLDDAYNLLYESRQKLYGRLRVTTTAALGLGWLSHRIHEFSSLYPDIQLQLYLTDTEPDLSKREADCAIQLHQPSQQNLIQLKLFNIHMHIYGSEDYFKKHSKPTQLSDLENHTIISYGDPIPPHLVALNWLESANGFFSPPRQSTLKINNLLALREATIKGLGLCVLPDYIVKDTEGLVQILTDVADIPRFTAYFYYHESLRNSVRMNAFKKFILSKAASWSY
ncbi:LysR family transcriptional regulator [Bartonella sp. DGB1]|uniref:LysR family transcriptional regulator n=1 Tax=Bartonella sp. DGB1 TaxID=3239807 RepID=UPI0035252ADB